MRRLSVTCVCGLALANGCCSPRDQSPVAQGDRAQIFYTSVGPEPADLDPQRTSGTLEAEILRALGEGLVNLDSRDLHPVPGAAESWTISPDGLVYTFRLRRGLRWSDGTPLTAADFVAGVRRELSPEIGSALASSLWPIRNAEAFSKVRLTDFAKVGVRASDPQTVEFTLDRPTAYFLSLTAERMFYPDRADGGKSWPNVGNGPFSIEQWKPQREIVARPNPYLLECCGGAAAGDPLRGDGRFGDGRTRFSHWLAA